jgi:hypothetical protein
MVGAVSALIVRTKPMGKHVHILRDVTRVEIETIEAYLRERREVQAKRQRKQGGTTVTELSHPKLFARIDDGVSFHFTFNNISPFEAQRAEFDAAEMTGAQLKRKYIWL